MKKLFFDYWAIFSILGFLTAIYFYYLLTKTNDPLVLASVAAVYSGLSIGIGFLILGLIKTIGKRRN